MDKYLIVFAGPNGSGKSTLVKILNNPDMPYICPDNYVRENLKKFPGVKISIEQLRDLYTLAKKQAELDRLILLDNEITFAFETVFSNPDKLKFIELARSRGYIIQIVFITTNDPKINIKRVKKRYDSGGHYVEEEAVIRRYANAMNQLPQIIKAADQALLFDNSEEEGTPKLVMEKENESLTFYPDIPTWAYNLIDKLRQLGLM